MTVLETEKSAVPSVQASMDRYITPEYLAHLPTSVSYTRHISDDAKNHDFMTFESICEKSLSAIILSLHPGTSE